MQILHNRVASPKELAAELGKSLGKVSYHVKYLERAGCIEVTATAPRRGAIEHYYQPTPSDETAVLALRGLIAEAVRALNTGSLDCEDEQSLTWTAIELDEKGRQDLARCQAAWVKELRRIESDAAKRLADRGKPAGRFVVGAIGFETPKG